MVGCTLPVGAASAANAPDGVATGAVAVRGASARGGAATGPAAGGTAAGGTAAGRAAGAAAAGAGLAGGAAADAEEVATAAGVHVTVVTGVLFIPRPNAPAAPGSVYDVVVVHADNMVVPPAEPEEVATAAGVHVTVVTGALFMPRPSTPTTPGSVYEVVVVHADNMVEPPLSAAEAGLATRTPRPAAPAATRAILLIMRWCLRSIIKVRVVGGGRSSAATAQLTSTDAVAA